MQYKKRHKNWHILRQLAEQNRALLWYESFYGQVAAAFGSVKAFAIWDCVCWNKE